MAPKRKPLSAAVEKSLRAKAEKSRFTYRQLAAVIGVGKVHICLVDQEMFLWVRGLWEELIVLSLVKVEQEKQMLIC